MDRIAGTIEVTGNGKVWKMAAAISYNMGNPIRETLVGPDSVHGYKETPQVASIEGEVRVVKGFKVKEFTTLTQCTVMAKLANGTKLMLSDAHFEGEGTAETEEGKLPFKFVSDYADES